MGRHTIANNPQKKEFFYYGYITKIKAFYSF